MECAKNSFMKSHGPTHSGPTSFSICSGIECSDDTFEGNPPVFFNTFQLEHRLTSLLLPLLRTQMMQKEFS